MQATIVIAAVAMVGILATAASFYALYSGPQRSRLAILVLTSAVLVGASPYIALALGTSSQVWMRGLMLLGVASLVAGLLIFTVTLVMSKRWAALVSAIPMVALTFWSFIFLAIFSTGVA